LMANDGPLPLSPLPPSPPPTPPEPPPACLLLGDSDAGVRRNMNQTATAMPTRSRRAAPPPTSKSIALLPFLTGFFGRGRGSSSSSSRVKRRFGAVLTAAALAATGAFFGVIASWAGFWTSWTSPHAGHLIFLPARASSTFR